MDEKIDVLLVGISKDLPLISNKFLETYKYNDLKDKKQILLQCERIVIRLDISELPLESIDDENLMQLKNKKSNDPKTQGYLFVANIRDPNSIECLPKIISSTKKTPDELLNMAIVIYTLEETDENKKFLLPKAKYDEFYNEFHCLIFEISLNDESNIQKPFHALIQNIHGFYYIEKYSELEYSQFGAYYKEMTIGMFGCSFKSGLMFRFLYGDYYEDYYSEYRKMIGGSKMHANTTKIVEFDNEFVPIKFIDSPMILKEIKPKPQELKQLAGFVFVFCADIIESAEDCVLIIQNTKEMVGDDLVGVIAVLHEEDIFQRVFDTALYNELEDLWHMKVFEFSLQTGKNVDEILFHLLDKIKKKKNENQKI